MRKIVETRRGETRWKKVETILRERFRREEMESRRIAVRDLPVIQTTPLNASGKVELLGKSH